MKLIHVITLLEIRKSLREKILEFCMVNRQVGGRSYFDEICKVVMQQVIPIGGKYPWRQDILNLFIELGYEVKILHGALVIDGLRYGKIPHYLATKDASRVRKKRINGKAL